MKLKILAAGLLIGSLLTFSAGCEIFCPKCPTLPSDGGQPGQVLFFDDFEDGADPAWSAASGTWIVKAGRYTVQEERMYGWKNVYVKTQNSLFWQNYAVDVDIFDANTGRFGGIIIRAQDDLNKVLLWWSGMHDQLKWIVLVNGEWGEAQGFVSPGFTARAHVRIEVVGNTYTAYVRQGDQGELIKRTWFTDDTFAHGMPGIAVEYSEGVAFDNFKVTSLGQ